MLVSLLLLGLNNVTLPLIWPVRLDYKGFSEACFRLGLSATKA